MAANDNDIIENSNNNTIGFIANGRNDMCAISRWLVSHIHPRFLQDSNNPVKIAVNGTKRGGKKIIPDAAREFFFTWDAPIEGRPEYDEYIDTPDLSFAFINVSWTSEKFSRPELQAIPGPISLAREFIKARENGGIVFIHNGLPPTDWADIEIELRDELDIKFNTADPSYRDDLRFKLGAVPYAEYEAGDDEIRRLVRIKIKNEELLNDPTIKLALAAYARSDIEFTSVIDDDDPITGFEAEEMDFAMFRREDFKPRMHKLASNPATWKNVPPIDYAAQATTAKPK